MTRSYRKLAGWIGILAVVFAQLAVSAFACPKQGQASEEQASALALGSMADDTSSMAQPALCHQHCANEQQNINDAPSPLASVSLAPAFVITLMMNADASFADVTLSPPLQRATSPPLSIRNCCFRI